MVDDIMGIAKCGIQSTILNTFINTTIEMKKWNFHTKDKNGRSKCHWMHIGKPNINCYAPKVHSEDMVEVSEDTYLGDLISNDAKNTKNIANRVSKGLGIIAQIFNILEIVSFGNHFIQVGLMLRESMLVNGILTNCESLYNMTKADFK